MKIISISNRKLCNQEFSTQIEKISKSKLVESIYLREKDLSSNEYKSLLIDCLKICTDTEIFPVKYIDVAKSLNLQNIHLSYQTFMDNYNNLDCFKNISVSVHNIDEAILSEKFGATRLITGHIFQTDCKKGVPPRGLNYLKNVCNSVKIPVYAIGGITSVNAKSVIDCGATGICIMSSLMQTDNPYDILKKF